MIFTKSGLKILYLVLHTKLQSNRYSNIVKTWGKNQNIIFYSDHSFGKNIIKTSDDDSRYSGESKIISLINNFYQYFINFDWFVFVDNDTFVNTEKLEKEIDNFDKNKVYGHLWNCWEEDKNFYYCLGGAGIFISKKNINYIKGKLKYKNLGWSDVSLCLNLKDLGIEMENNPLLHPNKPQRGPVPSEEDIIDPVPDSEIKNHITFHYITTYEDMYKLSKLCDLDQIKTKTYDKRKIKC